MVPMKYQKHPAKCITIHVKIMNLSIKLYSLFNFKKKNNF
jgi:hypothetical protein